MESLKTPTSLLLLMQIPSPINSISVRPFYQKMKSQVDVQQIRDTMLLQLSKVALEYAMVLRVPTQRLIQLPWIFMENKTMKSLE